MDFLATASSPSCVPVFDVHPGRHDGQDWFTAWIQDEANTYTTSQHSAGSVHSPLPLTSPSTSALYSFGQWTALLNTDCDPNVYAGRYFGVPNSDFSSSPSFQELELSSCYSSYVTLSCHAFMHRLTAYPSTPSSSVLSPLGDDMSLYPISPDQLFYTSSFPLSVGDAGGQDLVAPVQPHQHPIAAWLQSTDVPPPKQPFPSIISLPEELITTEMLGVANQALEGTMANNIGALPDNFFATPNLVETTALGLYYSDAAQSPDAPLSPIQVENNVSVPSVFDHVLPPPPPNESWKFLAVDPSSKAPRSKRARRDKTRPADGAAAASVSASHGTKVGPLVKVKCKECGRRLNNRMGDFRRHLMTHEADYLTRVVCCGVPPTHPRAASLRPGYRTFEYNQKPFHGGCGRSYSRMDALQRHLKRSNCIGGSAKDHQTWRRLYFSHKM